MHASGLWNFVPLETNADGLMGCHQMNLPEGFGCNHFLSIILLKQICLFKAFVSLLLSSLFLLDIDFLFQNIDSNKFPYIYSQINAHNSLLLSNYLIKMSQYPSFHYTFSILFVTYLSFSWFSWKIPITTSPEEFFSWALRSYLLFSWWRKV